MRDDAWMPDAPPPGRWRRLIVLLRPDDLARLEQVAEAEERTASQQAAFLIRQALARTAPPPPRGGRV